MAPAKAAERVLVIPTARLHAAGMFQGFRSHSDDYYRFLLDPTHFEFRPRGEVEIDPSFKQLIPYAVLRWRDQLFPYRRGSSGAEKRLEALASVGVGGAR